MAISAPCYQLLKSLKPILTRGGKLLEIGEANWYGDVAPDFQVDEPENLFAIAKAFYRDLFAPSVTHAVDINGSPQAMRQDLNRPLRLAHTYDVVINHGTAEHVFNIGQVFASIHNACKTGGLMIHDAPCTGWLDHGFYCLQPTLFYDLAAANGYDVKRVAFYSISTGEIWEVESREHLHKMDVQQNACIFVVFGKDDSADFRLPMQGVYDGTLSEDGQKAWEARR
jgi:SAM-dependent methyltransferase